MDEIVNLELEVAILGTLVGNGDLLHKVSDLLTEDCFTDSELQRLFICMKELQQETGSISKLQLYHKFNNTEDGDIKQNFIDIVAKNSRMVVMGFRSHVKTLVDLPLKLISLLLRVESLYLNFNEIWH